MLNGQIILDYNYLMADQIGPEQGLDPSKLASLAPQFETIQQQIQSRSGPGADFLGFLDLPFQDEGELERIQAVADDLAQTSDLHVVLGIGGSYLGAKALISALCHPFHNELSRNARQGRPRVYFEGNNLDADALSALLDILPQTTPQSLGETWTMNVISKSGGTIETAVSFRILRQLAEAHYGNGAANKIVATTDIAKGQLKALADQTGYRTFVIPDDVGGRYSVLTPVGLLPAAVAGINIQEVVRGAREMAEACKTKDYAQNPAYTLAGLYYLSDQSGRGVSVMNIWDKALEFVGFWYDQLAAESLGKAGKGRIPLTGVCTRDLHARGQQLQEGPRNTIITNIFVENASRHLALPHDPANADQLNYLGQKPVHEMLWGAYQGTNFAYAQDQRPNLSLRLKERSPYTLGALLYLFELATLIEGYLLEINPLDQPGVEAYKNFMFGLLGRADKAEYKAAFAQRKPDNSAYQL